MARVNLERAQAALAEAQEEYDKAQNRPWEGPDSLKGYQSWLDDARWSYEEAQAAYDQATGQLEAHNYQVMLLRSAVERTQLELDWLQVGVDPVLTQTVQSAQLAVDGLQFLPVEDHLLIPGVRAATRVGAYSMSELASQQRINVIGVDRATLPLVAHFRPDYAPRPLLRRMNLFWAVKMGESA